MRYFLIIIFIFFSVSQTFACDCPLRPNTKEDFNLEWNNVDYIFELKIIKIIKEPNKGEYFGIRILEAEILKKYKGQVEHKTIKIFTEVDGGANCNYYFYVGKSYLFYGNKGKDNYFHTSICNRTGLLSEKKFDLGLLMKKNK